MAPRAGAEVEATAVDDGVAGCQEMGSDAASLDVARRLLVSAYGTAFELIPETSSPTADLCSLDGHHVAEVKRVTSSSLRELHGATSSDDRTSRDVPELVRRWSVVLDATTNSDSLPPMPDFAEPSPEERVALEEAGFSVESKADREAEFLRSHPGPRRPTTRVKGLIDALIPLFKVLEAEGVSGNSHTWEPWFTTGEVADTQRRILELTGGAPVTSFDVVEAPPGINLHLAWGSVRTERGDTIAGRIQTWLDSDLAVNLRDSLWITPGVTRHGVLVFDAASEPEFRSASTDPSFIPSAPLTLPAEVDIMWAVFDHRALRFSPAGGWSASQIPSAT